VLSFAVAIISNGQLGATTAIVADVDQTGKSFYPSQVPPHRIDGGAMALSYAREKRMSY